MPKMHRNTFAGRDPLGELVRSPRPPSRIGGLLIRGGRGPTSKGDGSEERGNGEGERESQGLFTAQELHWTGLWFPNSSCHTAL